MLMSLGNLLLGILNFYLFATGGTVWNMVAAVLCSGVGILGLFSEWYSKQDKTEV